MPYLKQYIRLVTYQKSKKSMVWLPRRAQKSIFFTPFSPFSAPKIFFLQNCLCHILSSISGQSHTKNQKNLWCGCQEMLKNAYFSHLFRHFWPKKIFFQKSGFVSFLEPQKATLIPKIRKNYGVVRAESIRTDGRTDGRKYKSKSIVPAKFLGRSKNNITSKFLNDIYSYS